MEYFVNFLIPEATEFSYLVFTGRGDLSNLSTCPKRESSFQANTQKKKKKICFWKTLWKLRVSITEMQQWNNKKIELRNRERIEA